MDIAITGSSGLIGSALAASLRAEGHRVRPVVRRAPAAPDEISMDRLDLSGVDAVVHLAGEGIAEKRWDAEQKRKIRESRTAGTRAVAEAVAAARVPVLLSGSAIGYYGDRADEILTEESGPGTGFLAEVCVEWEAATRPAIDAGARVVHLRTGITYSARGGALAKMLPLYKLGLGGRMGTGRQWVSWITLADHVRATTHLLTARVSGPVNVTSPNPVHQIDFARTLGRVLRRPAVVPTPSFGPRLLLGKELAHSLISESQRVLPTVLVSSGFAHEHPDLGPALRSAVRE